MDESEFADRITQRMSGEDTEEDSPEEELEETPATEAVSEAPEEDTEEAPAEETEEERLLAGRYKTVEDLERAVVEKEELITRQGNEVGELRSLVEEYHARTQTELGQMKSAGFEPDEEWEEWADSEIVRGRETGEGDMTAIEAIVAAGAEGGPDAANYVLQRWYAVDPAAATAFQFQAMEMISSQAAMQEAVAADTYSDNGTPPPEVVEQAWEAVGVRHADVLDYRDAMAEALADFSDEDRDRWQSRIAADPAAGEDFVEYLYLQARTREAEKQLTDRDKATAQARRAKADREAAGDTVASATASPTRQLPPRVSGFDREAFRKEAGLAPME